jgi:hypothetical protein
MPATHTTPPQLLGVICLILRRHYDPKWARPERQRFLLVQTSVQYLCTAATSSFLESLSLSLPGVTRVPQNQNAH